MASRKTPSKRPAARVTKKISETAEHSRLKSAVQNLMLAAGFRVDVEIALNFSGNRNERNQLIDESSIDVVAYWADEHKNVLVIFECKGGNRLEKPNKMMDAWQ